MSRHHDDLVGLRFEVGGGLGRMSGRVLGKVGDLYLVQRQGAEHMELLELDDLRSAKLYRDQPAEAAVPIADTEAPAPATTTEPAPRDEGHPQRRRLSDQIKRHLGG